MTGSGTWSLHNTSPCRGITSRMESVVGALTDRYASVRARPDDFILRRLSSHHARGRRYRRAELRIWNDANRCLGFFLYSRLHRRIAIPPGINKRARPFHDFLEFLVAD